MPGEIAEHAPEFLRPGRGARSAVIAAHSGVAGKTRERNAGAVGRRCGADDLVPASSGLAVRRVHPA